MYSSYQGSSEIQADGLQTLYLMNPNYNGFSDTSQQSGNMLILNYAAGNGINLENLPNGHQQQSHEHHLVGVPLGSSSNLHDHLKLHEIPRGDGSGGSGGGGGGHVPHLYQSLWSSLDQTGGGNQENVNIPSGVVVASSSGGGGPAEVSVAQLGYHMPVVSPTRQGLSLSLSSQQPGYRSLPMDHNINHVRTGGSGVGGGNFHASVGAASSSVSVITHGIPGVHNFVLGSKYLKGAQELLDEVVSIVSKDIKDEVIEKGEKKGKMNKESSSMVFKGEASSNVAQNCELTSAQKQEIQMKKAKLINMLDEVEQRYSQYHHQMQIVVSSFEQATGVGSARSYTQLALQTISKQFRSLKDAITSQIKAASKSLGEDEILEGKVQGSRLKFVDQQIRQQKALQHFGMMQNNNVWRPQRGLPERAVSVLRAWLFEHFLHPYPKDSDKIMLAKQAGLTRSQVSNWFINARVRLWKPMVEEMYKEEMKNNQEAIESESNKNSSSKPTSPSDQINMIMSNTDDQDNYYNNNNNNSFNERAKQRKSQLEAITSTHDLSSESRYVGLIPPELNLPEGIINSPKKLRPNMQNSSPNSSILATQVMVHENGFGGFGELGSFSPTDGVDQELTTTGFHGGINGGFSLTLGLPTSQTMQQHNFHLSDHYNEVIHFESS